MSAIEQWVASAPPEIFDVISGVVAMNFFKEHRNTVFQMVGAYDGSMSEECKNLLRSNYASLNEFIAAIKTRVKSGSDGEGRG